MTDSEDSVNRVQDTIEKTKQQKDELVDSVQRDLEDRRTKVEAKVDKLNRDTVSAVSTAASQAKQSVHDVQYSLESTKDGAKLLIQGKSTDIKTFEKQFEKELAGYNLDLSLDLDYDVKGALVIEFSKSPE